MKGKDTYSEMRGSRQFGRSPRAWPDETDAMNQSRFRSASVHPAVRFVCQHKSVILSVSRFKPTVLSAFGGRLLLPREELRALWPALFPQRVCKACSPFEVVVQNCSEGVIGIASKMKGELTLHNHPHAA